MVAVCDCVMDGQNKITAVVFRPPMDVLSRVNLVLHAFSLLLAALATQAYRFDGSSSFGLSLPFCVVFALDAFVQSASMFSADHTSTSLFFTKVIRPLFQSRSSSSHVDLTKQIWHRVNNDEQTVMFALRMVLVVFTLFFFVSRLMQLVQTGKRYLSSGKEEAGPQKSKLAMLMVLSAMAYLCSMLFLSCADEFAAFVDQREFDLQSIAKLANQVQKHGFLYVCDGLIVLALLLASFSWPGARGEYIGMQHVLAVRWLMLALTVFKFAHVPQRLFDLEVMTSVCVPLVLATGLFVLPKFVRSHPLVFLQLVAVLGVAGAFTFQPEVVPPAVLDQVEQYSFPLTLVISLASLVACGGMGVTGTIVVGMTLTSIHAKDLLK